MAKVIGPLHSTEARGVIGGLIYNTWRGIRTVKRMTSPAQPRSKTALSIRALTLRFQRAWAALSSANQTGWNDYAAVHPDIDWTGVAKRLTGANWFVRCSVRAYRCANTVLTAPPATAAPNAPDAFAAADGILQSVLTWTAEAGTDKQIDIWQVGPHSLGAQAKLERAKFRSNQDGETPTYTVTGLFVGRYTFFARVIDEDTGLASTWVSDTADITAA